jgi:CelD/BcsL family acetyltransferase involved in cellulose biosynthesis
MAAHARVMADAAGFDELQAPWEQLTAAGAGDPLFGSFIWNRLWWKHYQVLGALRLFVVEEDGEVIGVWPLFLQTRTFGEVEVDMIGPRRMPMPGKSHRVRVLTYLGSGEICSDYLQPVVRPDRAAAAIAALVDALAAHEWDLLDLCDMPAESPVVPLLQQALARRFGAPRYRFRYQAPYAPLAATFDEYLDNLSKKSRYNARKKLRQLQLNHRVDHRFHEDPSTLREAMDTFIHLHQERWNADGLPGVFVNERFIGFHQDVAAEALRRGWLRLGLLWVNDAPVFATYAFHLGDCVYLYQQGSSADPHWTGYNLGYVALNFAVADAVARGAKVYDFLRGNAEYKTHWAKERRELILLQATRGWRGRWFRVHSAINTDDQLRAKLKRLIGKS